MQELAKMVDEDALVAPGERDLYRDTGYKPPEKSRSDSFDDFGGASTCEQCGSKSMYEDECMECGYAKATMLEEGDCGCNTCEGCSDEDDGTDYSIDTMGMIRGMIHDDGQLDGDKYHHNNYMH